MLFIEYRFILFFAVVFTVHWLLRRHALRKVWLLGASYLFYAAWDWRFLSLIAVSTLLDYGVGLRLARGGSVRGRKAALFCSIAGNLGILGVFKYYDFFAESAVALGATLGLPLHFSTLNIVLPVGISFYTFQTLSYTIDVYRGVQPPTRKLIDLALFVAFFPQLVAGPIVRSVDFLPQLQRPRRFAEVNVQAAVMLFLIGFFKKVCVSDALAPGVDAYFSDPGQYSVLSAWLAVPAYAVQIYCDFSGYTDMAIACAALLGYRLCRNFAHPYLACNITDFWRRWHISLSTWLRDYLYIPLGGNRGSRWAIARNILITMGLGGLWHGAAWHFVIWGLLHGAALVIHKAFRAWRGGGTLSPRWGGLCTVLTFYWVCVAWIFFRAPDLGSAWTVLKAFVLLRAEGLQSLATPAGWMLPLVILAHYVSYRGWFADRWRRLPDWAFAGAAGVAVCLMVGLTQAHYRPFIYFQF